MTDLKDIDSKLSKVFGDRYFGIGKEVKQVEYIKTGCPQLDYALGGGWPKGRMIELYGNPSSGKTTLATYAIKKIQDLGGTAVYINVEQALDARYMECCGVDTTNLLVVNPKTAEEALEASRIALQSGDVDLLVLDSVASLTPSVEYEKDVGAATMAVVARMLGPVIKQLTNHAASSGAIIIAINQLRAANLGGYGPSKDTPGGAAIKYHSSIRLDMAAKDKITKGSEIVGITSQIKVTKNKVGTPFRTCSVDILYPPDDFMPNGYTFYGLDNVGSLMQEGIDLGLIEVKGSWITWGKIKVQGKDKLRLMLFDDKELFNKLQREIDNGCAETEEEVVQDDVSTGTGECFGDEDSGD